MIWILFFYFMAAFHRLGRRYMDATWMLASLFGEGQTNEMQTLSTLSRSRRSDYSTILRSYQAPTVIQ
jgi:hypothetical protein